MAKKPTEKTPKPYPGSERFGDWSLDNIIPLEPGEVLVNDDPEGDPYKFARQGEPDLVPRKRPEPDKK
jgi:hypothetical protein